MISHRDFVRVFAWFKFVGEKAHATNVKSAQLRKFVCVYVCLVCACVSVYTVRVRASVCVCSFVFRKTKSEETIITNNRKRLDYNYESHFSPLPQEEEEV